MHTQCPHCQTIFRITSAHLNIAQGHVRCSHCQRAFNATRHLLKQLPTQLGVPEQFNIDEDEPSLSLDYNLPALLQEDIYKPHRNSWNAFLFWGMITLLLATMLAAQIFWFWQPDKILQHPQIRPVLDRFCHVFLCTLPVTRDVESFYIQEHIASVHPTLTNVIQFEVTFVNKAIFSQPYPNFSLTFEDSNGKPIAQRLFKPSEYLPTSPKPDQEIPPKAAIHFKLELMNVANLIEGNQIAQGYHFEFL
ncbi:MAG: DUF3426 domain-containing protein [Thioploca sp.]|nr:DUF3426 domain-containing protein [Thioploca sp.]